MSIGWDLLFHDVLYPISDDFDQWSRGDLAIEGGMIAEVGPELPRRAQRCLDGSSLIAFPGLFNMHTHGHDMLWRGAREGAGVDRAWPDWFWETYDEVSPACCVAAARATYLDSLRGGVTFLVDHLRRTLTAAPFVEALGELGLQGRVHSFQIEDPQGPVVILHETSPWFEASLEQAARLPRVATMLHAQETPYRLEHVYRSTGRSTVELLDDYGLLDAQTFLVHLCVHSDSDLERIAARGAHVVATPTAEMKLGERTLDPEVARKHGVSLFLGTDGPAYQNSNDLFEEVKLMALLWAREHGASTVRVGDLLAAVTWRAAEAVGRNSGRVRTGAGADLIFLAMDTLSLQPLVQEPFENLAVQIVYAARCREVRHVVIGGRMVIENGKCLMADEADVLHAMKCAVRRHFRTY